MSASPETSAEGWGKDAFRLGHAQEALRNERLALDIRTEFAEPTVPLETSAKSCAKRTPRLRHPRRAWRTERLARDVRKKLCEINASRETSVEYQYFLCFAWDVRQYACDATVSLETSTKILENHATDHSSPPADK